MTAPRSTRTHRPLDDKDKMAFETNFMIPQKPGAQQDEEKLRRSKLEDTPGYSAHSGTREDGFIAGSKL
ncbi:hypothetical protein DPEC_G00336420 [Dallia pectoralis]|uniref:Uncharacterized protein n=1 Tax=Dallia pectoralis TaxID=75939 RepID=A0ACC2F783_DALPE|nr:hypothetical protein DPEC_G00336420 [Dallia pectoralis]